MSIFKFENIKKSFDDRCVLNDLSYEFPNVGFVMLLGKSGSGKTTLLSILTGLTKKDKGKIFYNDKELISDKDFICFRKKISFVFQEYGIINHLTGYENLFLGGEKYDKKINLLSDFDLLKKSAVLSGGEKQRLSLMKALSKSSSIIFCDEPTGSLDEETGLKIIKVLKEVSKTKLVIMVTHNEELAYCYGDEILYLHPSQLEVLKKETDNKPNIKIKKTKYNILKGLSVAIKCFFQEKVKLFLTFLSLTLTLTTVFTLGSLKESSYDAIERNIYSYADFTRLKVSKITDSKIENTNFSLAKATCPTVDEISEMVLEYGEINYSFDTFFNESKIYCKNTLLNASIIVFPFINDVDEIRINREMYELMKDISNTINIRINKKITTIYNNKLVEDNIVFSLESKVNKIYDEFSFFNYPVIYISQESMNKFLKNINLKNLSKIVNSKYVSLYDRYTMLIDENDSLTNYSIYVDVYNKEDVFKVIEVIKNDKEEDMYYEVSSRAKITYDTLSSSLNLLELLMSIFSFISLILSFILMYLFINCMFEKRKKEFALYKTMGLDFKYIYLYNWIPLSIPLIFSFLTSVIFHKYLNTFLGDKLIFFFGFNIFQNSNYITNNIQIISLIILITGLMLSLYPSIRARFIKVNEVIKSE